jgi:hypothetical protein
MLSVMRGTNNHYFAGMGFYECNLCSLLEERGRLQSHLKVSVATVFCLASATLLA